MSKLKPVLFEENSDSENETNFNVKQSNEYAKNYNQWRKKEEINKLKTKYGELEPEENSSSSSEDDEEGNELTEEVEKEFFKTLSYLKNKDPRIYDENVNFFKHDNSKIKPQKKKEQAIFLKDYERNLILEKGGVLSDDENDERSTRPRSPTYNEEQLKLKESLKKALKTEDEEEEKEDENWGGIFKARTKTVEEKQKEEDDYKEWLAGQKDKLNDENAEKELKPLKDYWSNPKLDEGEKFLRDYILNKRFLEKDDENYIPTYEEIVHDSDENLSEDEEQIDKQEEFEHKYNFRFEEPDQDFIKRYPRTVESSLRKKDDKRSVKRAETKLRKVKEKEQKMEDIKKLQELKRQEIEEKIEKLKEIIGNADVAFQDLDLDGDFDPEAHDKRMQQLFNDEFYEKEEGDQKPEFPEIDEELEIENWDKWQPEENTNPEEQITHCEDDDFNMDCDYNPQASTSQELIENTKGKKRRRKSRFAQAVSKPKPKFDPDDKTYEEYLDEYYKLDCEDIIGDIPCRFKYRKVVPNSFGLTVDEILMANDRELNKWCSLKKAVQIRPDHVEKYDQIAFEKKAKNVELKKKILPSLFKSEIIPEDASDNTNAKDQESGQNKTVKRKKRNKIKNAVTEETVTDSKEESKIVVPVKNVGKRKRKADSVNGGSKLGKVKKVKKFKADKKLEKQKKLKKMGLTEGRLAAYGINPKKFKNKIMYAPQ